MSGSAGPSFAYGSLRGPVGPCSALRCPAPPDLRSPTAHCAGLSALAPLFDPGLPAGLRSASPRCARRRRRRLRRPRRSSHPPRTAHGPPRRTTQERRRLRRRFAPEAPRGSIAAPTDRGAGGARSEPQSEDAATRNRNRDNARSRGAESGGRPPHPDPGQEERSGPTRAAPPPSRAWRAVPSRSPAAPLRARSTSCRSSG